MIGRRRNSGFRRRAPRTDLLTTVLIANSSGSEVTEPVSFGVSLAPGVFNPSTQRLADGWEYGKVIDDLHGNTRHITVSNYVTVPASSSIQVEIRSEAGLATTPTAKTPSELLSMASDWECALEFVDESATTWTNSARTALGGSTTWAWNTAYRSTQALQDTSIVKEWICARPYFDSNPTANDQLGCIFSVSFYSDDNFSTIERVKTQVIDHNAWYQATAGDRIGYAGALTIRGGVSSPSIDEQYSDTSLSSVTISWSGSIGTLNATESFDNDDLGKAITDGSGLAAIVTFINSTNQITLTQMVGSTAPTSPTGVVMRGVRKGHMTTLIHDHWWGGTKNLEVRPRIQDIRDAKMLLNTPAPYDVDLSSVIGNNPAYHRVTSANGGQEQSGFYRYSDDNAELVEHHSGRSLNLVDGNGFITSAGLAQLRVSERAFAATHFRQFFISKTTGLATRTADVATNRWNDYSWQNLNWVHRQSLGDAHLYTVFYPTWLITGDYAYQWATYQHGFTSIQLAGELDYYHFLGSGSPRRTACVFYMMANASAALPKTTPPTGTLIEGSTVPETVINDYNWSIHLAEAGVNRTKVGSNLPQWADLQPYYTNYSASGWLWQQFQTEYLFFALIAAYETGSLKTANNDALRALAGNEAGRVLIAHYQSTDAATPAEAQRNMYSSIGFDTAVGDGAGRNLITNTLTPITPANLWSSWHDVEFGASPSAGFTYGGYSWACLEWCLSANDGLTFMAGITDELQEARDYLLSVAETDSDPIILDGNGDPDWTTISSWNQNRYKRVAIRGRS